MACGSRKTKIILVSQKAEEDPAAYTGQCRQLAKSIAVLTLPLIAAAAMLASSWIVEVGPSWLARIRTDVPVGLNQQPAVGQSAKDFERALLAPRRIKLSRSVSARARRAWASLPLSFEINQGQSAPSVTFVARGSGFCLFLTPEGATLRLGPPRTFALEADTAPGQLAPSSLAAPVTTVLGIKLAHANPVLRAEGSEPLPGRTHYLLGHDPKKWRTNVPSYGRVNYREVYPGVDLTFYGTRRRLEYDFMVAPGADVDRIELQLEGADTARVDKNGDLVVRTADTEFRQLRPIAYQDWGGLRHYLPGRYVLRGTGKFGFAVAGYRSDEALVIDPVLVYSSFLGGGDLDVGHAIAVDVNDNVYLTGETLSVNFPTQNPEQPLNAGGSDAFVVKLNPTGSTILFSTYLGGSGNENNFNSGVESSGIAVDSSGNVYVAGRTSSTGFPVMNAVLPNYGGGDYDGFVSKLSADGSTLLYSTYLGGEANDSANAIAVDSAGNIYVTGGTRSVNDFPITPGAFQSFLNGQLDAYVAKIDPTQQGAASLVYATYLGGTGIDRGTAIAVDSAGQAYVTGRTESPDFPTRKALQAGYGGAADAFVTVLNAIGTDLLYSTFLGGAGLDVGNGIAVDVTGNVYITGETASTDFPTMNGFQTVNVGSSDAFVAQLDPTGQILLYATYLGGTGLDRGTALAVDSTGTILVTGETSSDNFPTFGAFQPARGGGKDAFVARLDPSQLGMNSLLYSSFLGGSADDLGLGVAVASNGDAWVIGQTASAVSFPTVNPVQPNYGGGTSDAFVAQISSASGIPDFTISATPLSVTVTPGGQANYTVTLAPAGGFTGNVGLSLTGLPANTAASFNPPTVTFADATPQTSALTVNTSMSTSLGSFPLSILGTSNSLQHTTSVTLVVTGGTGTADLSLTKTASPNPVHVLTNLTYTIKVANQGPSVATGVQVTDALPSVTLVSATTTQGTCSGTSTVTCSIGTLGVGAHATVTIVVTPQAIGPISNTAAVSGDQPDPNPDNNSATAVTSVVLVGGTPVDVLQHHLNPTRDGLYVDPLITQAAAINMHRDPSFNASLIGPVYAQPLYVNSGPNGTAAFIVATEQNDVVALDAGDGSQIWLNHVGTPVPRSQLPCGNIDPLGITGTPVIDTAARTLYVAAMTTPDDGTTKQHLIFALSLDDGSILPGWPVPVDGMTYGAATFDSTVQNQRGALLLNGGALYVPYGGNFGDCGAYHGWVVAVPVANPSGATAWATEARAGGVWAPGGLATDGQSIFAITGNTFGATSWMGGEAVIRLGPGATFSGDPADYFAPSNWPELDASDLDIGGAGPVLFNVPGAQPSQLLIALGKNGVAYLHDPSNLGGIGTGDGFTGEGLQSKLVSSGIIRTAAAAYTTPSGTFVVFNINSGTGTGIGCPGSPGNLVALKIGASAPPTIDVAWCADVPGRGSPIVTTIDGTSQPVVWAVSTETTNRLLAFNGETGEMLFSGGGPDEQMTFVRRFQTPIAVNGRIIVVADDKLFVFTTQ